MDRIAASSFMVTAALVLYSSPSAGQASKPTTTAAQPPHSGAAASPSSRAVSADYMLVFWFDRKDPIKTFHFQAYDIRKGQYDQRVKDWLAMMAADYPSYDAYSRRLELAKEKGRTEKEKVASAVMRELLVTASYAGVPVEGLIAPGYSGTMAGTLSTNDSRGYRYTRSYGSPSSLPGIHPLPSMSPSPGAGGLGGSSGSSYTSPFPYPYVRPHP
ncbi:MAG TPA: hypothetical protein VGZ22_16655 [Isosphaeraceae bacterium]|jgi:hypothetical protein|nr:hypothetical protein [Isosphaeraceae bacterium]